MFAAFGTLAAPVLSPSPKPQTGAALGPHIVDSPSPDLPLTNGLVQPLSESWIRSFGSPARGR